MELSTVEEIEHLVRQFNETSHGSSDYDQDPFFFWDSSTNTFAPCRYLFKKSEALESVADLNALGVCFTSHAFIEGDSFKKWYEKQFSMRPKSRLLKNVGILYLPERQTIFKELETITRSYEILREHQILLNGKNLPIQLGEWYAKSIFGLRQVKSTSQRGFDFELDGERTEVKIHWSDTPSPKGVKIRKSMAELSKYVIVIYLGKNFLIRELCFLDSNYVLRKFGGKGHTLFLKDGELAPYFFGKSTKHYDKVKNKNALLTFSNPALALRIQDELLS